MEGEHGGRGKHRRRGDHIGRGEHDGWRSELEGKVRLCTFIRAGASRVPPEGLLNEGTWQGVCMFHESTIRVPRDGMGEVGGRSTT